MNPIARQIVEIRIEEEMKSSYLDYSMSVIIGRALPDARDGLKPVHRRILYAMHQMGLSAGRRYIKCAGVVGEVLKKFHPHGDAAVYDALVRMAQPWNLRYLLVDGQGNFGSVDGDPAAAYRYTECRMTRPAEELLVDIDQETVDFSPNFDGTEAEPDVLPSRIPNLLVNGADGIAVGMATKIPPHNLREVCDAAIALIDQPDLSVSELMAIVPGPDFPTAGTIYGRHGIRDAYETGRGKVVVRGNATIEERPGGATIVIDELPYQVNKARLVEQIAELVKDRKLEGIRALRDESSREGMRVVIECKKDAFAEVVLNHLYKHTALQSTFGVILLAIVENQPRILSLREMLQLWIAHRREVVVRRMRFQLRKAREREHILEGFRIALDHLDALITLIRSSATPGEAKERMMPEFGLTEIQADAILELRLQRLTGMERQKILDELEEIRARILEIETILASETLLMGVVRSEVVDVRDKFGDPRRTRIVDTRGELSMQDLVAEGPQVVTLSHRGYIKRCSPDEWRAQRRGGLGTKGMDTREADFVSSLLVAHSHATLMVFTSDGKVFPLKVYEVPESGRGSRGRPIINLVPVAPGVRVAEVVSVPSLDDDGVLVFVSMLGVVKRTNLEAFRNLRPGGMIGSGVDEGDELVVVARVDAGAPGDLMLFTLMGQSIRFSLDEVPDLGRTARGNRGIALADGDEVVDALVVPVGADPSEDESEDAPDEDGEAPLDPEGAPEGAAAAEEDDGPMLLTVTQRGYGKRTPLDVYRVQGRYGKGIIAAKVTEKSGGVVAVRQVLPDDELLLATDTGRVIRIRAGEVRKITARGSLGVRLMRLEPDERLVDVASVGSDSARVEEEPVEGEDG
jgi:DNA gyrase subunit A